MNNFAHAHIGKHSFASLSKALHEENRQIFSKCQTHHKKIHFMTYEISVFIKSVPVAEIILNKKLIKFSLKIMISKYIYFLKKFILILKKDI